MSRSIPLLALAVGVSAAAAGAHLPVGVRDAPSKTLGTAAGDVVYVGPPASDQFANETRLMVVPATGGTPRKLAVVREDLPDERIGRPDGTLGDVERSLEQIGRPLHNAVPHTRRITLRVARKDRGFVSCAGKFPRVQGSPSPRPTRFPHPSADSPTRKS